MNSPNGMPLAGGATPTVVAARCVQATEPVVVLNAQIPTIQFQLRGANLRGRILCRRECGSIEPIAKTLGGERCSEVSLGHSGVVAVCRSIKPSRPPVPP